MAPDKDSNGNPFTLSGVSVNKFVGDFVKENVDNYLHKHLDVADVLLQKIQENEKERKAIAGVTKLARERAKKANLHNRKLRDCRVHLNDPAPKASKKKAQETEADDYDPRFDSAIFITEGDSASGSITKSRDVNTQAVFSLRGKPLNCYGLTKRWCMKTRNSTSYRPHSTSKTVLTDCATIKSSSPLMPMSTVCTSASS